jgi:hypothetical protein
MEILSCEWRGLTYGFVQGSHHIIVLADLCGCCEKDTPDRNRAFYSQLYPFTADFYIGVGVILDADGQYIDL